MNDNLDKTWNDRKHQLALSKAEVHRCRVRVEADPRPATPNDKIALVNAQIAEHEAARAEFLARRAVAEAHHAASVAMGDSLAGALDPSAYHAACARIDAQLEELSTKYNRQAYALTEEKAALHTTYRAALEKGVIRARDEGIPLLAKIESVEAYDAAWTNAKKHLVWQLRALKRELHEEVA